MNLKEATDTLQISLIREQSGTYLLPCQKVFLKVQLQGRSLPVQFTAKDEVRFRIDEDGLTVEKLKTGAVYRQFAWKQVESLAAGEPETDNGPLFQG
jgi:hypothetical protein